MTLEISVCLRQRGNRGVSDREEEEEEEKPLDPALIEAMKQGKKYRACIKKNKLCLIEIPQ